MERRFSAALLFLMVWIAPPFAHAQSALIPTRVVIEPWRTPVAYGNDMVLAVKVFYDEPCSSGLPAPIGGTLTLKRGGVVEHTAVPFYLAFYRDCVNGTDSAGNDLFVVGLEFGSYSFTAEYSGDATHAPSTSEPVMVGVVPDATAMGPDGLGPIEVGAASPSFDTSSDWFCAAPQAALLASSGAPPAPPGVPFPFGVLRYDFASCQFDCGFLCPGGVPTTPQQRILLQYPGIIPPSSTLWVYAPLPGQAVSGWQRIAATIRGARASFLLNGADGAKEMNGWIGLSSPVPATTYQDQWWAGPEENGWGLSIAQSDQSFFVVLYIYDDDGKPMWTVLPAGTWDGARRTLSGNLYRPTGSWFANYDVSVFKAGDAIGAASLSFSDDSNGTVQYTIEGKSGVKSIRRLAFAPSPTPVQGRYAGLWWGGVAGTGWGVAIGHQDATLFVVWYTYDKHGDVTWLVMPGGSWTSSSTYSGTLYATTGSPWIGATYDPTHLTATAVGSLTLSFSTSGEATMDYMVNGVSGTQLLVHQPF